MDHPEALLGVRIEYAKVEAIKERTKVRTVSIEGEFEDGGIVKVGEKEKERYTYYY